MRPVSTFAPHVDVSTRNGYTSVLRLLLRRQEAAQLTTPAAITFRGVHGIAVQHHADDPIEGLTAVWDWAKAFGLPLPRLGGSRVVPVQPGSPWRTYGTKGVCLRVAMEVWCPAREDSGAARNFISRTTDTGTYITTNDTDERKWA